MSFIPLPPVNGEMLIIVDALILLSVLASQQFLLAVGRRWWPLALFALCWSVIVVATSAQNVPPIH